MQLLVKTSKQKCVKKKKRLALLLAMDQKKKKGILLEAANVWGHSRFILETLQKSST